MDRIPRDLTKDKKEGTLFRMNRMSRMSNSGHQMLNMYDNKIRPQFKFTSFLVKIAISFYFQFCDNVSENCCLNKLSISVI